MLLLLALSIGIVGMVEKDMHGEWVVVQQQQGIRAARIGGGIGIGIIASLLLLRGRRHTLYAFVNWTLWPALRALSGWIRSGVGKESAIVMLSDIFTLKDFHTRRRSEGVIDDSYNYSLRAPLRPTRNSPSSSSGTDRAS